MGLMRKTLSVSTLGIVPFRSKKEKLRRAERSQRGAETALEREKLGRVAAEARVAVAEKRVKHTSAEAAQAAKRLEQAKRRSRRAGKAERLGELISSAEPIVRSGMETARDAGSGAVERGRRAGRQAGKAAKRAARDAKQGAERSFRHTQAAASSAKDAISPNPER